MSDDEDLYCNPQTNIFLQARLQRSPPKTHKKYFSKKPPPSPKKAPKPRPAVPASASKELGDLFKNGVTRPSELRKTPAVDLENNAKEKEESSPVIDFRAHLRSVPSPIKTEDQNRKCSVSSEADLPIPPPPPRDHENSSEIPPDIKSPPIPKRTSTLSNRRAVPPPNSFASHEEPSNTTQEKEEKSERVEPEKSSLDLVINENQSCKIIPSLKRRPLQNPSVAPGIPIHTFPDFIESNQIVDDISIPADSDEMYLENEIIAPEELPPPLEGEFDELYIDNEVPPLDESDEEMYTDNDPLPPLLPQESGLYDTPPPRFPPTTSAPAPSLPAPSLPPMVPTLPQREEPDQEAEDEELYADDVCPYPVFQGEAEDEELYADDVVEYPIFKKPEDTPVIGVEPDYNLEDEGDDDIYDDISGYTVDRPAQNVPAPCPSPLSQRSTSVPPSILPPPPKLPVSTPPSATSKKQKGGLFGIFKKNRKKSTLESGTSVDGSIGDESIVVPAVECPLEVEDDGLYNDGERVVYSDDDDEAIYEEQ